MGMVTKDFTVRVSDADESYGESTPLGDVPRILAERKAMATPIYDGEAIIGCDTVVIYGGELMGKPCDKANAVRMLTKLSGTTHEVISGICVRTSEKTYSCAVTTYVKFRPLSPLEIENYVNTYNPVDKAGAYGIQESAGAFVEKIDGDFYNVVGLPLCKLCQILNDEFQISLL